MSCECTKLSSAESMQYALMDCFWPSFIADIFVGCTRFLLTLVRFCVCLCCHNYSEYFFVCVFMLLDSKKRVLWSSKSIDLLRCQPLKIGRTLLAFFDQKNTLSSFFIKKFSFSSSFLVFFSWNSWHAFIYFLNLFKGWMLIRLINIWKLHLWLRTWLFIRWLSGTGDCPVR